MDMDTEDRETQPKQPQMNPAQPEQRDGEPKPSNPNPRLEKVKWEGIEPYSPVRKSYEIIGKNEAYGRFPHHKPEEPLPGNPNEWFFFEGVAYRLYALKPGCDDGDPITIDKIDVYEYERRVQSQYVPKQIDTAFLAESRLTPRECSPEEYAELCSVLGIDPEKEEEKEKQRIEAKQAETEDIRRIKDVAVETKSDVGKLLKKKEKTAEARRKATQETWREKRDSEFYAALDEAFVKEHQKGNNKSNIWGYGGAWERVCAKEHIAIPKDRQEREHLHQKHKKGLTTYRKNMTKEE